MTSMPFMGCVEYLPFALPHSLHPQKKPKKLKSEITLSIIFQKILQMYHFYLKRKIFGQILSSVGYQSKFCNLALFGPRGHIWNVWPAPVATHNSVLLRKMLCQPKTLCLCHVKAVAIPMFGCPGPAGQRTWGSHLKRGRVRGEIMWAVISYGAFMLIRQRLASWA